MTEVLRIRTRDELVALANRLGMRGDWHEPEQYGVTAQVFGIIFDNAGEWGEAELARTITDRRSRPYNLERWVTLSQHGEPVAEVALATLFAFATGFTGE